MTFTFYSGRDSIKVNQRARYPGQSSKVTVRAHAYTQTYRTDCSTSASKVAGKTRKTAEETVGRRKGSKAAGRESVLRGTAAGVAAWIHDSAETTTAKRLAFADSRNAVTAARGRANEPTPAPRVRAGLHGRRVAGPVHLAPRQPPVLPSFSVVVAAEERAFITTLSGERSPLRRISSFNKD